MRTYDSDFNEIREPDLDKGRVEQKSATVIHTWVEDSPEEGEWATVAEYEGGGRDVEWRVTKKATGHWETTRDGKRIEWDAEMPGDWRDVSPVTDLEQYLLYTPYTEQELAEREAERAEREERALYDSQLRVASALFVRTCALTDEQALSVSMLYEEWDARGTYAEGDVRRYGGGLYRCRQAHRGQADWTPDAAHSLWRRILESGEVEEWGQPQPGVFDGYEKGDRVTHGGKTWESTYDGLNVWEPGATGSEGLWAEVDG